MSNMILKRILKFCCVALFGCLIICLLTAPFVFNQNNQVGQHNIVCADSVSDLYSYTSSNFYFSLSRYTSTSYPNTTLNTFDNFEVVFNFNSDNSVFLEFWNLGDTLPIANHITYFVPELDSWIFFPIIWDNSYNWNYLFQYYRDSSFNNNVVSVSIESYPFQRESTVFTSTNLTFYDNNNNIMRILFITTYDSSTDSRRALAISRGFLVYDLRTYYLTNSFTDNEAYQAGVQYGTQQGLASNQQDIFDRGFSAGKRQGDDEGYIRGVNDANQYSFFNLMGAVMDAPVKAFIGLFNFNFLGVNLLNIASGIVTFAVVVRIVRLVLGGR